MRWKGAWHVFQGPFEVLNIDNKSVFSIVCMDFYGAKSHVLAAQNPITLDSTSWQKLFKPEQHSRSFLWSGPSREFYSKAFAQVMAQIKAGNWKKAVPIAFDRSPGTLTDQDKIAILGKLSSAPQELIPYGYWKDGEGMIGLTPEILFSREKNTLTTMALAGTEKKLGPSYLLNDDKNLKEHDFVVQELSEKLRNFGHVTAVGPAVLELPTLYHLQTKFSVELSSKWDDLKALTYFHPTSAVGISPYKKWKEMEQLPEQKDRNFFAAPLLFKLSPDKSLALVALRQIQWNLKEIMIGAGGGVVQESQEELEWQEILAKMDSVRKLMGIS